jgi:predicted kinase
LAASEPIESLMPMTTYILMAGLPGTGKSTLAEALARELNGVVLSKDAVRAALFSGPLTDYTREQDDLCFGMVLDAASYLARRNATEFIFLDGRTFSRSEQIEQAIRAAELVGCAWRIILTTCSDAVAEERLVADVARHPAANRTLGLYREIEARFEPITRPHVEIDTAQSLETCAQYGVAQLLGRSRW